MYSTIVPTARLRGEIHNQRANLPRLHGRSFGIIMPGDLNKEKQKIICVEWGEIMEEKVLILILRTQEEN